MTEQMEPLFELDHKEFKVSDVSLDYRGDSLWITGIIQKTETSRKRPFGISLGIVNQSLSEFKQATDEVIEVGQRVQQEANDLVERFAAALKAFQEPPKKDEEAA